MTLSKRERDTLARLERELSDDEEFCDAITSLAAAREDPPIIVGAGAILFGVVVMFATLATSLLVCFVGYLMILVGCLALARDDRVRATFARLPAKLAAADRDRDSTRAP